MACRCRKCLSELPPDDNPIPHEGRVFVVCEVCGNKRCPHATYHGYVCTNSNEPMQLPDLAKAGGLK